MFTPSLLLLLTLGGDVPTLQVSASPAPVEQVKKAVKSRPKPKAKAKKKPVKREIDDDDLDANPEALGAGEVAMQGITSGAAASLTSLLGLLLGGVMGAGVGTVLGCISCMATLTLCSNSLLASCLCVPIACGVGTISVEGISGLVVTASSLVGGAAGWLVSGVGARRRAPAWAPFAFAIPAAFLSTAVAFLASAPFLALAAYYGYSVYAAQVGSAGLRNIASDWAVYSTLALIGAVLAFFLVQTIGAVLGGAATGLGTALASKLVDGRRDPDEPDDQRPIPPSASPDDDDYIPPSDPIPDDKDPPLQPYEPYTPAPAPAEPSPILPD